MSQGSLSVFINIALAIFWSVFLSFNILSFESTGNPTQLLVAIEVSITIVLFLIRERPILKTSSQMDHAIAIACTFAPLLLRPARYGFPFAGTGLMIAGISLATIGLIFLGTSFGISPAVRRVRTSGPYRFMRHPMYAGLLLTLCGYLLGNLRFWNGLVLLGTVVIAHLRIEREEKLLKQHEIYRTYAKTTQFRIIPFLY